MEHKKRMWWSEQQPSHFLFLFEWRAIKWPLDASRVIFRGRTKRKTKKTEGWFNSCKWELYELRGLPRSPQKSWNVHPWFYRKETTRGRLELSQECETQRMCNKTRQWIKTEHRWNMWSTLPTSRPWNFNLTAKLEPSKQPAAKGANSHCLHGDP